jgi:hypothetical protein
MCTTKNESAGVKWTGLVILKTLMMTPFAQTYHYMRISIIHRVIQ